MATLLNPVALLDARAATARLGAFLEAFLDDFLGAFLDDFLAIIFTSNIQPLNVKSFLFN
jgi:hypothetical protein